MENGKLKIMVPCKARYHNSPFSILNFQLPNDSKEQFRERRHEQHTVEAVKHSSVARKKYVHNP